MDKVQIVGPTGDGSGPTEPAVVDHVLNSHASVHLDTVHNRIHRGHMFEVNINDAALANADTLEVLLVVIGEAHFLRNVVVGGDAKVQLYEGTTTSASGSEITPQNRNRTSTNVASCEVYSGPTITDDGTLISDQFLPGGVQKAQSVGAESRGWNEWVLAPGNHLLRLTNISGAAQIAHIELNFYEDFPDIE